MPKQTARNARFNDQRGIAFEFDCDGTTHTGMITLEGLEAAYAAQKERFARDRKNMLKTVETHSYLVDRAILKVRDGAEPFLNELDFLKQRQP